MKTSWRFQKFRISLCIGILILRLSSHTPRWILCESSEVEAWYATILYVFTLHSQPVIYFVAS